MNFEEFKKKKMNFEDMLSKINEKPSYEKDERFWYPKKNETGNYYSVIRFLPDKDPDKLPYRIYYRHSYDYNGKYYIENCPTTLKDKCPQCEDNKQYWVNKELKSGYDYVRSRSRKTSYISNIYVINDPANPENNGKVFLYAYGQDIYKKIISKMCPEVSGKKPIDIFCFYNGCQFELQTTKKKSEKNGKMYTDYSISEWGAISPLLEGDSEKLKQVYNKMFFLDDVFKSLEFKTYEELEKRVNFVCYDNTTYEEKSNNDKHKTMNNDSEEMPFKNDTLNNNEEIEETAEDDGDFFKKFAN